MMSDATKRSSTPQRKQAHPCKMMDATRAGNLEMVKQEPGRWVVVNADRKWDEVQEEMRRVVERSLS